MSNFKVGQKVVCLGTIPRTDRYGRIGFLRPSKDEIVTVHSYINHEFIKIEEYLFDIDGKPMGFKYTHFEPLKLDYNFVEEVINQVKPKHHEESI